MRVHFEILLAGILSPLYDLEKLFQDSCLEESSIFFILNLPTAWASERGFTVLHGNEEAPAGLSIQQTFPEDAHDAEVLWQTLWWVGKALPPEGCASLREQTHVDTEAQCSYKVVSVQRKHT